MFAVDWTVALLQFSLQTWPSLVLWQLEVLATLQSQLPCPARLPVRLGQGFGRQLGGTVSGLGMSNNIRD